MFERVSSRGAEPLPPPLRFPPLHHLPAVLRIRACGNSFMAPNTILSRLHRRARACVAALSLAAVSGFAGVTVTQNVSPGATSWPGTPLFSTVSNPASQLGVGESFGGATSYTETFTVVGPNNYTLQAINLYAGGGSGTTPTATITLNLYDLGAQAAPNPSAYVAGVNLFGGGSGLPITYTTQANGVLQLNFTDADQVLLIAGHLYAFEIAGVSGTQPMLWYRTTADTYSGGAAYRNRGWINGNNARDFGLAVYGVINNAPPPPTTATVNAGTTFQQIDGFGAGAVFLDFGLDPLTDAWMDALYGTGPNQMALNLIRLRISPYGPGDWTNQILDGQKAAARGVKILATPWTPPAAMKDNNNTVHGSLLPSQYGAFVDYLNSFTDTLAANGAPVSVVSVQNEPDFDPDYEGCVWTPTQLLNFSRDFAGGLKVPYMMPESFSFKQSYSDPTLNDPTAAANVDYIGGHLYGGTIQDYPLARSLGKHIWMTEYLINDQTISSAISTAQQINDCLTVGNMSGYIWWKTIGNANGLLNASGVLQRRAYVMSQYSRFVRPGYVRIAVTGNSSPLGISAFRSEDGAKYAIVAVNNTTQAVTHTFTLQGIAASTVTPVITSATQSLEAQASVDVSANAFTYTIPATSIVTFTAQAPQPVTVSRGGFVYNRRTNRMVQQVTLANATGATIKGPVRLALDDLSSNTSLANSAGVTIYAPSGSPYIVASSGDLAAGATVSVTLEFTYPTSGGITYTARTIVGAVTP